MSLIKSFRWLALAGAAALTYQGLVRPWHLRWGALANEAEAALPGDELVPAPRLNATHAVTIAAPPAEIWPWLVQIGQGRGGFYSLEWIENLLGLNIHNADRLLPEFQSLKVGDLVPLAPNGFGVPVAQLEPERSLVLHGDTRLGAPPGMPALPPGEYFTVVWSFHLRPMGPQRTRLLERWRADWSPSLTNTVFMRAFLEPGGFVMERQMLLGLKQRAEAARSRAAAPEALAQ